MSFFCRVIFFFNHVNGDVISAFPSPFTLVTDGRELLPLTTQDNGLTTLWRPCPYLVPKVLNCMCGGIVGVCLTKRRQLLLKLRWGQIQWDSTAIGNVIEEYNRELLVSGTVFPSR